MSGRTAIGLGAALASAVFLAAGCGSGKDGGTARTKFRLDKNGQSAGSDDILAMAPPADGRGARGADGSELAKLRERERAQAKTVEEMRRAMAEGEGVVRREEAKLKDIRMRIAALEAPGDGYADRSAGRESSLYPGETVVYRGEPGGGTAAYDSQYARSAATRANQANYRGRPVPDAGYSPAPGYARTNAPAPGYAPSPDYPPASAREAASVLAPARPAGRPTLDDEEDVWNPPVRLYENRSAAAMPARAAAPQATQHRGSGQAAVPPATNRPAPLFLSDPSAAAVDNRVFSPDLVLPGGR